MFFGVGWWEIFWDEVRLFWDLLVERGDIRIFLFDVWILRMLMCVLFDIFMFFVLCFYVENYKIKKYLLWYMCKILRRYLVNCIMYLIFI